MSRLDEIRKGIESGGCDQCEDAAELLAVVDAFLYQHTPESLASRYEYYVKAHRKDDHYRDLVNNDMALAKALRAIS